MRLTRYGGIIHRLGRSRDIHPVCGVELDYDYFYCKTAALEIVAELMEAAVSTISANMIPTLVVYIEST